MLLKLCLIAIIVAGVFCEDVKENDKDKQPSQTNEKESLLMVALMCATKTEKIECLRTQSGRLLDSLEHVLNAKRDEVLAQADREVLQSRQSRGLERSPKRQQPSYIMKAVENGLEDIGDYVSSAVEDYVAPSSKNSQIHLLGKQNSYVYHPQRKYSKIYYLRQNTTGKDDVTEGTTTSTTPIPIAKVSTNEGRQFEVSRKAKGKKKKKKALMKLFIAGAVVKAKIELLLKLLSAHLQIKFFAIALIGLLINIARFWIDLKKGHHPQKVIYYEHAQHQHHYDEHDDEGWGGGHGSTGYWKRSLNSKLADQDPIEDRADDFDYESLAASYKNENGQRQDAQQLVYSNHQGI